MAIRLIDDIDKLWKFSTTRLAFLGAGLAAASPALQVWDVIPASAKLFMPDTVQAAMPVVIICVCIIIARATTMEPAAPAPTNADSSPQG